jgi:hypothetical protein
LLVFTPGEKRHNFRLLFVSTKVRTRETNTHQEKKKQIGVISTALFVISCFHCLNDKQEDGIEESYIKLKLGKKQMYKM